MTAREQFGAVLVVLCLLFAWVAVQVNAKVGTKLTKHATWWPLWAAYVAAAVILAVLVFQLAQA